METKRVAIVFDEFNKKAVDRFAGLRLVNSHKIKAVPT